ncbi:type IV toxin-antitoxin system AbiEi family antitoxin domain-containing protein [Deinococcus petrolearius]|uniref:Type IV toxin-antitoxin system AbiEi family antitoxin domain-containing protein n=1 Tax=Deinococcus petrolearius TaxID=1751295 RepID=A0ABW1DNB2_9DEIO
MSASLPTLRDHLPEGVPVPVHWLHAQGLSSALVHHYVRSGWLQALPGQAYLRPGPPLTWPAALYAAQQVGLPVHVGHLSALALQGLSHYQPLGGGEQWHLYLPLRPPTWLAGLPFSGAWHREQVFYEEAPPARLAPATLRTPTQDLPASRKLAVMPAPRLPWLVFISAPERAALELAAGLTRGGSWDMAYETFTGLTMLRPAVVRELLLACTRVVTRRVFLHLAHASDHAWLEHLDLSGVDLGTGDRQVVPQGRLDPLWRITVPRLGQEAEHGF